MFKMTWACGIVVLLMCPQFLSIREIDFSDTIDTSMENEVFPRDAVQSCGEHDIVNLSNLDLSTIFTSMIKSNNLRHIDLSFNNISEILGSFFRDVPKLECLNLTSNAFAPAMVLKDTYSESLKTLILDRSSNNGEYKDPCNLLGYFPNLETLHLNKIKACAIDKSSFMAQLPRLTTLYLMDYNTDEGMYRWTFPVTLRHLHVEGSNLGYLNIPELDGLQSLYLDRFTYVTLDNLKLNSNLQVLSCRQCRVSSRTIEKFFDYNRDGLKLLDLSNNSISNLPNTMFQRAQNLEGLVLSNNSFTKVPDVQALSQLRGLVLSHNEIDQVQDMKSNSLTRLGLRGNRISTISVTTFQGLPALEVLDLSHNKLASMPVGWANGLKNLFNVNLKFNLFARVSDTSLATATGNLSHLFVKGNPIKELVPDNCTLHCN